MHAQPAPSRLHLLQAHGEQPAAAACDAASAAKVPLSIRIDGAVLAQLRGEAERLGIGYQTLIGSILQRYVDGALVDPGAVDLRALLDRAS